LGFALIDFKIPFEKREHVKRWIVYPSPAFLLAIITLAPGHRLPLAALKRENNYSHRQKRETNGLAFLRYWEMRRISMCIRGIRGAITVEANRAEAILLATRNLLEAIQRANPSLVPDDLASAFFTLTDDLSSAYPAQAARELGWTQVPMMCSREIPVPGSLPRTVRVLLHWNTVLAPDEIRHVYLGEAVQLRPDLVANP
jgi:chorismate mutase